MRRMTWYRRSGTNGSGPARIPGRWPRTGIGLAVPALAAALVLVAAGHGTAQKPCDESAGTLGIQGLRCEGCTYSMSESGIEEARFRTEPQVLAVVRGFIRGDRLRPGDRIVAIDDALVTTREGSDRLVSLRAGQSLTVRVRRDGRVIDLAVTAGSACELRRAVRDREVEVERLDERELPPGFDIMELPPTPPAGAPLPPLAAPSALPAPPAPPAFGPSGYLGFGLQCSRCGFEDGVMFFSAPPTITGMAEDGPAGRAGLEPGDIILAVDGLDITGEGARRFGEIEPGQRVRLTVRRGEEERTVAVQATERPSRPARVEMPAPAAPPRAAMAETVQFRGGLGDIRIEVRGAPVTVTRDEATGELVIRTSGNVIRLTREGGG